MIWLLLTIGAVNASGSARYDSPYSIEQIVVMEAVGLIETIRDSDEVRRIIRGGGADGEASASGLCQKGVTKLLAEAPYKAGRAAGEISSSTVFRFNSGPSRIYWNGIKDALCGLDLTRQRISELARAMRTLANTLDVRHSAGGQFAYSYRATIRGIEIRRSLKRTPGYVTTSLTASGPIHTQTDRVGPVVCRTTLVYVWLNATFRETARGTTVSLDGNAECIKDLRTKRGRPIRCCLIHRRANSEIRQIVSGRIHNVLCEIIRRGRQIAARGRTRPLVANLLEAGLRVEKWR